jgi:hypothetical protein
MEQWEVHLMMKTFLTGLRESLFPMNLEHSHECLLLLKSLQCMYYHVHLPTYMLIMNTYLSTHTHTYMLADVPTAICMLHAYVYIIIWYQTYLMYTHILGRTYCVVHNILRLTTYAHAYMLNTYYHRTYASMLFACMHKQACIHAYIRT